MAPIVIVFSLTVDEIVYDLRSGFLACFVIDKPFDSNSTELVIRH